MNKRIKVLVSAVLATVMLVLCIPFTAAAAATSATFDFTSLTGTGADLTGSSTLASIINGCGPTGSSYVTDATATKVYNGNGSGGKFPNTAGLLKFGTSSANGVLTLTLTEEVNKVEIVCYAWSDTASDTIKVNECTAVASPKSGTWGTKSFDIASTNEITITTEKRGFIQSITVYFTPAGACEHTYDGCADTTCNKGCGHTRTALEHVYDGCEDTTCNNCTAGNRAAGTHAYTNEYDAKCDNNGCSNTRIVTLPAADSTLDIPTATKIALAQDGKTADKYYVEGVITNIYNTTYGNMYIEDANGNEICIYGSYDPTGATRYDAMTNPHKVGDTVKVYGKLTQYNGTAEVENGWVTVIPNNPNTGDGVVAYIAVAIVALFGIAYVSKKH